MSVFLSYSHEDAAFARYLAGSLRAVEIEVWFDEERMRAGDPDQARIAAAARASAHAIFLVSRSWLTKKWTRYELTLFEDRDPAISRSIAVLLSPRADLKADLPPALVGVSNIVWLSDDPDPSARLWEVYCAVAGQELGPRTEWSQRGAALAGAGHDAPRAPAPPPPTADAPSVFCDRSEQWSMLDALATAREHQVIFLQGARGQAHDTFLRRIELRLQTTEVRRVSWPWRPAGEDEFREALAQALQVHVSALAAELASRLAHRNLTLLHDRISDDFEDEELVRYYAEYVPRLVADAKPAMALKCVQGIEWLAPPLASRMLGLLTGRGAGRDRARAASLLARMLDRLGPPFRALTLPELTPITDADVRRLCETRGLDAAETERLLERIDDAGPTSDDKLKMIDDFLRARRQSRKDAHGGQLYLAAVPG